MSPIRQNPTKKHKRKLTSGLNLPSSNLSHQLFTISVHRHATCITNFQPFLSPGKMGETTSHPKWIKPKGQETAAMTQQAFRAGLLLQWFTQGTRLALIHLQGNKVVLQEGFQKILDKYISFVSFTPWHSTCICKCFGTECKHVYYDGSSNKGNMERR